MSLENAALLPTLSKLDKYVDPYTFMLLLIVAFFHNEVSPKTARVFDIATVPPTVTLLYMPVSPHIVVLLDTVTFEPV
jgi:hypothetical protein